MWGVGEILSMVCIKIEVKVSGGFVWKVCSLDEMWRILSDVI